jgi:hypothetical protein
VNKHLNITVVLFLVGLASLLASLKGVGPHAFGFFSGG